MPTTPASTEGEMPGFVTAKRVSRDDMKAAQAFAAERYQAGDSLRTIANFTGWSYGKTHRMVTLAGVALRPRGGYNR